MTVGLFPRISPLTVEQLLGDLDAAIADAIRPLTENRMPVDAIFGASGGNQIALHDLANLRSQIIAVALNCGFPNHGSVADRSRFDSDVTGVLADFPALQTGEADRDDVWAFIATVLLPDIVAWRFEGRSSDRFHGGIRNAFQRLWMRAWALDRGKAPLGHRWAYVKTLTEDGLVQITERPSIGGDRELSKAIARAWTKTAEVVGRGKMEDIMRRAIIDIRIRNEIQMLGALEESELDRTIESIFSTACEPARDLSPSEH